MAGKQLKMKRKAQSLCRSPPPALACRPLCFECSKAFSMSYHRDDYCSGCCEEFGSKPQGQYQHGRYAEQWKKKIDKQTLLKRRFSRVKNIKPVYPLLF